MSQYGGATTKTAPGRPIDQTVIHKLFGHAGKHVMARTVEAYGLKLPSGVSENCESCDVANLRRNPTTSVTRNPDQPIVGLWEVDLPSRMPPGDGGVQYPFDAVETDSGYVCTSAMRTKGDSSAAVLGMIEDIRIRGGPVRHIRFDTGGEFIPKGLAPACVLLDVSISWVTTDRYVNHIENSHNRLSSVMRANHADANLGIAKWPFNRACAAHMLNMRATSDKSRDIPTRRLTGRHPPLATTIRQQGKVAA